MDPGALGVMIPVIAMLIGGFVVFAKSDIGRALAHRLGRVDGGEADLVGRVEELRSEMDSLRAQLIETQERLDFTERLLSRESSGGHG